MNYFYAIIEILAGLGCFMLGFKLLSENMEKLCGNGLKKLFNKTSGKKLVGVGMGAVTTAVVQSSAVTTVMVVGFVNAGIMTLNQAAAIIMGANIGTTITAQIVALQFLNIKLIFAIFAFLGIAIMMFGKGDRAKLLGLVLAGFGIIFVGLNVMSHGVRNEPGGIAFLQSVDSIKSALENIKNPFLLLMIGVLITAVVQSSGAVTAIIISMASADLIIGGGGNGFLYVILGSNIGTCVTALLSSKGTSVNARRASIIHLLFNVIGSLLFMVVLLCIPGFQENVLQRFFGKVETQIAMFHTFFNVLCTVLFLPFTNILVKTATLIVKDSGEKQSQHTYMDKRFLNTPAVAIRQLKEETFRMGDMAMESFQTSFNAFINRNVDMIAKVYETNETISEVSEEISNYLVQVSAHGVSLQDEKKVSALHNNVGDLVRISELADNFTKYTKREVNDNLTFSPVVAEKITEMHSLLKEQYALVKRIVLNKEPKLLKQSDELEEKIDEMRRVLVAEHIVRMEKGECRPENNSVFINLVSNLERIGDHLGYVAHSWTGLLN